MEVLHGDIKITLSDQEAIRGLRRTRDQVKRGLDQISREKAVVEVEANLKQLERNLKQARAQVARFEGMQAEVKLGLRDGNFKQEIARAKAEVKALDGQTIDLKLELENQREAVAGLKQIEALEKRRGALIDQHNAAYEKERILNDKIAADRDKALRNEARLQQEALTMDRNRTSEVAKLQKEYDNANRALQRMRKTQKPGLFTSPETRLRFDINQRELEGKMEVVRARLEAMNAKPIHIEVDIEEKRALEKLANLGNIGTRIGPFSGTLKEFTRAGLVLGPIITGLLGSVTALAGAIGAGLAGAAGIAGGALGALGLSLGGVALLSRSLFRDFKNLNTLQDAYHKQVLKTGADSDKAKVKLKEFNHALGEVTPTTRAAFMTLDKLQDRWRGLRKEARPDFFNALGQAITTINTDFSIFSRGTLKAFHVVSGGFQDWMKGLRTAEAQNIIFRLMDNGNRAIPPLMHALGQLGAAAGRVMAQFSDHLPGLAREFDHWSTSIGDASGHADKLSTGVDNLMTSFHQTLGVATALSRVIIAMTGAAMGPGGDFLQKIADGLNGIADSIHNNPDPLRNFFGDSIATTEALFQTFAPLVKLFMEFSTILRPATTAVLSIVTPVADLVQSLAGFEPIRLALQGWATLWLFKRGSATAIMFLTGAVKDLGNAFKLMNREAAASTLPAVARGRTTGVVRGAEQAAAARGVPMIGTGPAAVAARGGAATYGGRLARVAGVSGEATRLGRGFGIVSKGLGALSMGLLGVSAPVAGLGIAAVAAGIGIKKLHDAAEASARQRRADDKTLNTPRSKGSQQKEQVQNRVYYGPYGSAGDPSKTQANAAAIERETRARHASAEAIRETNAALTASFNIQRDMVSLGSQLSNADLMVEQAEKAYADAVKHSGKNSLDARMALQQLRDARTQETQASRNWGDASIKAGEAVKRAVTEASKAYKAAIGTRLENEMADNLDHARNSAAVLEINLRRARKGVDTFSGEGADKIGKFMREFGKIPGVKRTMVQVDTEDAAVKLASVISDLENVGKRKTVTRILADAKNPKEALKELNAAMDRFEKRHPVAHLQADKHDAETKLSDINKQLSHYGARKPEALLKARDEAQKKLDRLNKQLDTLDGKDATVTAHVKFTLPNSFKTDAGSSAYPGGSGDGTGVTPDIAASVKSFAEKNPSLMTKILGANMLGSMPVKGSGLNAFNGLAQRFGLTIGSGLRPGAITVSGNQSYHALGRARDFPGPPAAMMAFAKYMAAHFGSRLKELIYTPLGWGIKNGHRIPNAEWGPAVLAEHYSHVHVAMAKGGKVEPGKYNTPHVLFAEEPGHPEYFISTNPRDKKRSQGLVRQAAGDLGMTAMASGGKRGVSLSTIAAPGGGRLSAQQQRILQMAVALGKSMGAGPRATSALIEALWAESKAQNLGFGDASSTGPLQLLASTAHGLHVNPRNVKAVMKLFLRHGFTGKGGAIKIAAHNKHLSAAQIATMVQGNRDGASTYSPYRQFASRVLGAVGGVGGALGGSLGGSVTKPEPKVLGRGIAPETILAEAQARVDTAATTNTYTDDIRALLGYNTRGPRRVRIPIAGGRGASGIGSTAKGAHGTAQRFRDVVRIKNIHHNGLVDVLKNQTNTAKNRLQHINKLLHGRLTKDQRGSLLQEQTSLTQTIADNRTKINDARKTAADAQFNRNMRKRGIGSQSDIDFRSAKAATSTTLTDDLAAAQAEQSYYKARENWAKRRGDKQGRLDARNAYNSATDKIKSITDQMKQDKTNTDEAWITWAEGQATLTGSLQDDFDAAGKALTYWQGRVQEAWAAGDTVGALSAGANVQQYTERVQGLKEDMARLPLERDAALAALTDDTTDDVAAAKALQSYWADRLEAAKQQGDLQGQIDAAGNLKTLNDQISQAEQNVSAQMILLSQSRQDLFKNFGSNFIPGSDIGSRVGAGASGTTVNLTVNGAELGPDPFTWSNNVAWELQAAV